MGIIMSPDEQREGPIVTFPGLQNPIPKSNLCAPGPAVPHVITESPCVRTDRRFRRETQQPKISVVMFSQSNGGIQVHFCVLAQVDRCYNIFTGLRSATATIRL